MRRPIVLVLLAVSAVACGPAPDTTPVQQPDTLVLGRVASVRPDAGDPTSSEVALNASLPETMQAALKREGKPVPQLDNDYRVAVKVTRDSVCVAGTAAADVEGLRNGLEVVVVPVPGTTTMVGSKRLQLDAAEVMQFQTYQAVHLTRSLQAAPDGLAADPARVNSAGTETTPIAVQGGKVLYFAAGLQQVPLAAGRAAVGAVRPGMRQADGAMAAWTDGGVRPYRTAWNDGRWSAPAPVDLPGLPPAAGARVTWVDDAEKSCLVEVVEAEKPHRLMAAERADARAPWGALVPVALAAGESTGDGQRFGRQLKALVWTAYAGGSSDLWLSLDGQAGKPLEPRINTMGPEWAPRRGPAGELYFCRANRQLVFKGNVVNEVRLPGTQLRPLVEATAVGDGNVIVFRVQRYTFGEADWDIAVATRQGNGWSAAVPFDEWRPAAS